MHVRAIAVLLLLALPASTAGCIANMGDLKEALGVREPPPVPLAEPTWLPPLARAQANVTSVPVQVPVRFSSEGTRDPQGFGLELAWSFGDGGSAVGPTAVHAYAAPGEYAVRLTARSDVGLTDVATLTLQVIAQGRPPVACFTVLDESGAEPAFVRSGAELTFDASCSNDPEGGALAYDWDLGGATSHDAKLTRSFDAPGRHVVKLKVTDPSGLSHETTRVVAVDYEAEEKGSFDLMGPAAREHSFPFAQGARKLELTLTFPGGLGGNDLALLVKDADGKEVERTSDRTAPGAQDAQVRTVVLAADDLARLRSGTWTAEVTKTQGLSVEYTLAIRETF